MEIDTEDIISESEVNKRLANAEKGVLSFEKEITEIEKITEAEIAEAEVIESLLNKLKQSRKLDSKKEALNTQKEKIIEINNYLNSNN